MSLNDVAWLTLLHAPGVGPATGSRLLDMADSIENVLQLSTSQFEQCGVSREGIRQLRNPDSATIERDVAWLEKDNHHLISIEDPQYPELLRNIPDPPLVLFVKGDPQILSHPQIAMVGSRNASSQGLENAAALAHYLASEGFVITSGLARGIDAASHHGALQAMGFTIAVCGTGLDQVYPRLHQKLSQQIELSGALVSEFPTKTEPHKSNFPRRNRIISGLSVGTLVIEAAQRSGSLITARLAGEQGREIFAVPGSIHNPMSNGCHRLIQQGAKLVGCGRDIIEELGNLARTALDDNQITVALPLHKQPDLDTDYDKLLQTIGFEPSTVNQVCQRTGLTPDAVSSMLLILELRGYVTTTSGGRYERSI